MSEPAVLVYGREKESAVRRSVRAVVRWVRRILLLLVLVLVVLYVVAYAWSTHRLKAEHAAIAAAGEPVKLEDIAPKPIDDIDNGYVDLKRAMSLIAGATENDRIDRLPSGPQHPLFAHERSRLKAYVDTRPDVMPALDAAWKKPQCQTPQAVTPALLLTGVTDFNDLRQIAYFARYNALLRHDEGDDAAAMRSLQPLNTIAAGSASYPSLVGHLVATGVLAMQSNTYQNLAADLRIGSGKGDASPEQVRAAITQLLDNGPFHTWQHRAVLGERVFSISMFAQTAQGQTGLTGGGQPWPAALRLLSRPWVRHNEAVALRYIAEIMPAVKATDWPSSLVLLRKANAPVKGSRVTLLASILTPTYDRFLQSRYRVETDRALAAVALAARLHEAETGRPPSAWSDLVPRFLPSIPADPLALNGSLRARFDATPIVWSVGDNGTDEGGDDTGIDTVGEWRTPDRVQKLTLVPRVADAITQQLIDLDVESPVAATPPAPIVGSNDLDAPPAPTPAVDLATAFEVSGDVSAFAKIKTRRDVLAVLDDVASTETPFVRPANVLAGTIREGEQTTIYFELAPDGTGVFRAQGCRDTPFQWFATSVDGTGNEVWR